MADVAPGIITFGLGGSHTNMIIGNIFQLGYITVGSPIFPPIPPEPDKGGNSGGGIPLAPGEINKLYQPVDEPWGTLQDYQFPDGTRFPVTIKLKFREYDLERNYIVSKKRAKTIVKVIYFAKRIHAKSGVIIKNFKKKTLAAMQILNLRKK